MIDAIVTGVADAARDTRLYTFAAADGRVLPAAEPGAHIALRLPGGLERQYSLVTADPAPTAYTVGIKRDREGRGGSAWIHDNLKVGDRLPIEAPRNNFPLDEGAAHTVLFAGGIGITPIWCMAQRLAELGRSFELHYSCRSRADMAFREDLAAQPWARLHFADEGDGAHLPLAALVAAAPPDAHLYCCGPAPMLEAFEAACAAAGRPRDHVHVEYFAQKYEAAVDGGFTVELARTGRSVEIPAGRTILQVLLEAGLDVPYSCEEGVCGTCETRVLGGEPDHRDALLSDAERAQNKTMMICCSGSKSPRLVLDL